MDLLVDYYRSVSGEHPDWDDYRAAMERDQRVMIAITPERVGPSVQGYPPSAGVPVSGPSAPSPPGTPGSRGPSPAAPRATRSLRSATAAPRSVVGSPGAP